MDKPTIYKFSGKGMPVIPFNMLASTAPTGFPSPALDYEEDVISLDRTLIKNPDFTYLMLVVSDAMNGAGVLPNSLIVVDRSAPVVNMTMIVATVDGELLIRFYTKEAGKCFLLPANPKFKPIEVTECMDSLIWGVVIHIITSPKPTAYVRIDGL